MVIDELCAAPIDAVILRKRKPRHADAKVFPHLKVQMRRVEPSARADGAELLSALQVLAIADLNGVEVTIKRIHKLRLTAFLIRMPDDHDVAPSVVIILGKKDDAVRGRKDRCALWRGA